MKRFIASSLVITSILAPLSIHAKEKSSNMITNADYVNVREGATTAYEVVDQLKKGQKVKVIDEFTNAKGELWYRVDLGSVKGWVISKFLTQVKNEAAPVLPSFSKKTVYTNSNKVVVRKGASITYPSVETLNANQKVTAIDQFVNRITGETWIRIQSEKNLGWVQEKYLKNLTTNPGDSFTEKLMYISTSKAKVHKGATDDYDVVLHLELNNQVKVVDTFTNAASEHWSRILVNGTYGWIKSSLLTESYKKQNVVKSMYVSQQTLAVRKGASTNYPSIAKLKINQKVTIVDQFNSSGELWYRLKLSHKLLGWVPANGLSQQEQLSPKVKVSVTNAIVRSGASTAYKKVTTLQKGRSFSAIDTFTNSKSEIWYRIEYSKGRYGWISSSVVSVSGVPTAPVPAPVPKYATKFVGTKNAYLYRGADFGYKVKTKLDYGSKLTILKEFTNISTGHKWLNVKSANGHTGWIPSWEAYKSLKNIPVVYNVSSPKLYKGASTSYPEAGKISSGTPLINLAKYGEWYNVETVSGIRGWIQKKDVSAVSPKGLLNPVITKVNASTHHIKWEKAMAISNIRYTMPSSKQILISGDIASIDLPANVHGVVSTKTINNANGTKSLQINLSSSYTFTLRNYENTFDLKVMKKGLTGKKIIVDAGHGDYDPGAIGPSGVKEKDVNLAVAKYLKKELENNGATVLLTRSTDEFLELSERTDIANHSDYDVFVSIHSNSFNSKSRGTQTFYDTSVNFNGVQSKLLAQDVQAALTKQVGTYDRGYTDNDFYVTRENELTSILVELAYLSNPNEEKLLKSDSFRKKAAAGIRIGIQNFFN
jgi:N-acetylmuramoyl-L-alanine amidase